MKMDIQEILAHLLKSWWVVVLSVVITASSTLAFGLHQDKIYQATTTVDVQPSTTLSDNQMINIINVLSNRRTTTNTFARRATSGYVEARIASKLNVSRDVVAGANLTAVVPPETTLIEIRAEANDPKLAAAISNAVAEELVKEAPSLVIMIEIVDYADPESSPISPQPSRLLTMGIVTGVILGLIFAILLYVLQRFLMPGPASDTSKNNEISPSTTALARNTPQ